MLMRAVLLVAGLTLALGASFSIDTNTIRVSFPNDYLSDITVTELRAVNPKRSPVGLWSLALHSIQEVTPTGIPVPVNGLDMIGAPFMFGPPSTIYFSKDASLQVWTASYVADVASTEVTVQANFTLVPSTNGAVLYDEPVGASSFALALGVSNWPFSNPSNSLLLTWAFQNGANNSVGHKSECSKRSFDMDALDDDLTAEPKIVWSRLAYFTPAAGYKHTWDSSTAKVECGAATSSLSVRLPAAQSTWSYLIFQLDESARGRFVSARSSTVSSSRAATAFAIVFAVCFVLSLLALVIVVARGSGATYRRV